ncbi:MAG TPA: hypothetical protein DDW50_03505 [Firmicutes bacterium]|jgi:hypothetical protein|nr:hypothetical protein [Bacillota bacterium]
MSCSCTQSITCGSSRSTITIPQNAVAAPLICSLPCVREFSTSVARFQNQIVREVLVALSNRCQAEVPPPLPPGTLVVLSNTTTFNQSLAATVNLQIEAAAIISVNVTLQNVQFQIVGFSSVIVQIIGDAVITVTFQGIDGLIHTQTATVPFVFTETIPGTFPANSIVQGSLSVNNQTVVNEIDPSTLAIVAVSVTLFFATNIIILAPVA